MINTALQVLKAALVAEQAALVVLTEVALVVLKISSQASLVAVEAETPMPLVKVTICNIVLIYLLKRLYLVLKKKLAIIAKQPAALV